MEAGVLGSRQGVLGPPSAFFGLLSVCSSQDTLRPSELLLEMLCGGRAEDFGVFLHILGMCCTSRVVSLARNALFIYFLGEEGGHTCWCSAVNTGFVLRSYPDSAWGTLWDACDWNLVCWLQGKCPSHRPHVFILYVRQVTKCTRFWWKTLTSFLF